MEIALFVAVVTAFQDAPGPEAVRALVGKLRSDSLDERDRAEAELKRLRGNARPELEKAAKDADGEVAGRARRLLRVLEIRDRLMPDLLKAMPGVEERLAGGDERAWTQVVLRAFSRRPTRTQRVLLSLVLPAALLEAHARRPGKNSDLELLAGPALRGATTKADKLSILDAIERHRVRGAIPEMIALLKDRDSEVCRRAVRVLGDLRAREAVPEIVKLVENEDVDGDGDVDVDDIPVQRRAVKTLGRLGSRDAIPSLLKALERESQRMIGVEALAELGAKESCRHVVALLKDPDSGVRARSAAALGRLGAREAIPELVKLLRDDEGDDEAEWNDLTRVQESHQGLSYDAVCGHAARALADLDAREAIPELLNRVNERSHDDPVRPGARYFGCYDCRELGAFALGLLKAKEGAPELLKRLKDKDESWNVRTSAAWAFGRVGSKEAAPELMRLLVSADASDRCVAADTLGDLGAKDAIPALQKLLKDDGIPDSSAVRRSALDALGKLAGKEAMPACREVLTDDDYRVRCSAASWLGRFGSREGVPVLLKDHEGLVSLNALRQPDAWSRLSARLMNKDLWGSRRQIVDQLAMGADLELELPEEGDIEEWWTQDCDRILTRGHGRSLLDGVLSALEDQSLEIVLEPGRIRILTRENAQRFWQSWWDETQRK